MAIDWHTIRNHILRHRMGYGLVALVTALNHDVWIGLIQDWSVDPNYSHGFLIVPISGYILYARRKSLSFPAVFSRLGVALLVCGGVGLIAGIAASEFFVTRFSLVLQLTGIGLAYLGWGNFKRVWFAFVFLLFMIPIPAVIYYSATLPMQLWSTKITTALLHLVGIPVVRQGHIIHLPEYSLEVIEACSGLRSLVALLATGSFYAWLSLSGWVRITVLVATTIPIALAANVFRIFVTALGAYSISREVADSFLHEISGLLVFVSALVMMMVVGGVLRWTARDSS